MIPIEYRDREQRAIEQLRNTGVAAPWEKELFRKDGSRVSVLIGVVTVLSTQGDTERVAFVVDISERKHLEQQLRHAQKLEAVGSLAAGMAHEINTPIQFVGDNARFLQDSFHGIADLIDRYEELCEEADQGAVRPELLERARTAREKADWAYLRTEVPKALEQMLDGVGRVATIVRAMKEFSHVDQSVEKTAADLNKALESTLVVARNELKFVAEVETHYGELPLVMCHLGDLNQVFLNLLVNAAHAIGDAVKGTGEKGRIGVRTKQEEEWVEIAISDTGTGVPERIRERIFDPFFTTKEVGKGSGQGLALARAIVMEKHGGTLTFETEMGKGTTFYVRLPVNSAREAKELVAR
jgi:signal transduction histidine kinase